MAVSRPLAVAIAAMALLVASVGFEVLFHRSYAVEVRTPTGWAQIGTTGGDGFAKPIDTRAGGLVTANRSDTLEFRVRVDNGYPWGFSEAYDVRVNGIIVAEGTLSAPARATGESAFQIPAETFFATVPKEAAPAVYAYLDVQIGNAFVGGNFQLQEAK